MADEIMTLAGEFPSVSHDEWLAAVDKVLRGRPFDDVLRSRTADGILIEPLYTLDDERRVEQFPAASTGRRGGVPDGLLGGWDVRQRHHLTTASATNDAILTDLQRGVTSIELVTAGITDVDTLDAVLKDVLVDIAPLALVAAGDGVADAERFLSLADRRGVPSSELVADLGCDPIGNLARHGHVGRPIDAALPDVAALAAAVSTSHPHVRTVRADGAVYADAGASPATELAATVATGLQYVRVMVEAGLGVGEAFDQVLLAITVGTDQFGDIAKLRALRVLWSRIAEVSGLSDTTISVQASTAGRSMTRYDPWVNMLRVTIGCFAAAVGGANAIMVHPFDAMVGLPDDLGLRIARNTQLALMEESNIHRVIDPAGGSWYVERLTDQLAQQAWGIFRELEADGGSLASLRRGNIQRRVAASAKTAAAAVATRDQPITGVSEFPDIDGGLLARAPYPSWSRAGEDSEVEPLPSRRLAAEFEALRDRAAACDDPPTVFAANLGPVATHGARAMWAKNFFEAGGLRVVGNDGFDDPVDLAEAFSTAGSRIAVLCSSDDVYADQGVVAAAALRQVGAERVYLAGRPGPRGAELEAGGVDEFIHQGCDVLAALERAHEVLGLAPAEAS